MPAAYQFTIEGLIAAVRDRYLEIAANDGAIYKEPDGRAKTEAEAAKVITAIVHAGCLDEDESHPSEIIDLCSNPENGYGCWLDDIRSAVRTVDLSFTDNPEKWFERLEGARRAVWILVFRRWQEEHSRPAP